MVQRPLERVLDDIHEASLGQLFGVLQCGVDGLVELIRRLHEVVRPLVQGARLREGVVVTPKRENAIGDLDVAAGVQITVRSRR